MSEAVFAGTKPGEGKYRCLKCGYIIEISDGEELPLCPLCGYEQYEKVE